jgi:hypothetical protein
MYFNSPPRCFAKNPPGIILKRLLMRAEAERSSSYASCLFLEAKALLPSTEMKTQAMEGSRVPAGTLSLGPREE